MSDYLTDAENDIKVYFESHHIPKYFYRCMFGELVKIWGVVPLIPDKDYCAEYDDNGNIIDSNEDEYSYKDQLSFHLCNYGGTGSWYLAFEQSCIMCDMPELKDDYSKMDWVHSDIFDGYIADNIISTLFDNDGQGNYYRFMCSKENTDNTK